MTSVHHASSPAANSVKGIDKSKTSGLPGGAAGDTSSEFADLFGAMIEGMPGQDLAAPAVDAGQIGDAKTENAEAIALKMQALLDTPPAPPVAGLAAEVLGPSVHIITPSEPAISDDSLMAFARSQGLDEDALAMIFGRRAAPDLQVPAGAPGAIDPLATAAGSQTANDLLAAAVFSGKAGSPSLSATPSTDPAKDAALLAAQTAASSETLDLGPDARLSWRIGEANALPSTQQAPGSSLQSALFGLNGIRALPTAAEAATQAATQAATEVAAHPEASNQSLAASLILGAAEASQFARRQQIKQFSQRAERVGEMLTAPNALASNSAASNVAGVGPAAAPAEPLSELLMIDTGISDSELQQLMQQRHTEGRQQQANPTTNPAAAEQLARSDLDMRAEQYDKLSQRLAEALGQRLAAQIARGDWKVEMALRPKDLGNIDIELHMRRGELQASFSASQLGTRDLIAEGLPKLREVLAQLGMEVASVDVNVRQESQHGGNPTPGKQSPGVAGVGSRRPVDATSATSALPPARSTASSSDGLDVLV
ncbi:MAG: flagellar hook-length control protein FliK [Burkholderiaceae bacterium]|nr:flagellar hook-length control protein FliK [Burkholderiaceae bacterium]